MPLPSLEEVKAQRLRWTIEMERLVEIRGRLARFVGFLEYSKVAGSDHDVISALALERVAPPSTTNATGR